MFIAEQLKEAENQYKNQIAVCYICGEEFEYKQAFAEEHLKKYPLHRIYGTKLKK